MAKCLTCAAENLLEVTMVGRGKVLQTHDLPGKRQLCPRSGKPNIPSARIRKITGPPPMVSVASYRSLVC